MSIIQNTYPTAINPNEGEQPFKKEFQWTDELVKEFAFWNVSFHFPNSDQRINEFKKSKEKDIPTVKPDWEIIQCIGKAEPLPHNYFPGGIDNPCTGCLDYGCAIYSVKRLSDGEVFTVGDEVIWNLSQNSQKPFTITSFKINNILPQKRMFCNGNNIDIVYIEKVKPKEPLFTTEDGVEIFDYKWVSVDENFQKWHINRKEQFNGGFPCKRFSTLEKADEYINQNKPVEVSYKDMMAYLATRYGYDGGYNNQVIKEFFQSKINP